MAGPRSSSAVPLGPMTAPIRMSPTSPGRPRRSNSGGTTRNRKPRDGEEQDRVDDRQRGDVNVHGACRAGGSGAGCIHTAV